VSQGHELRWDAALYAAGAAVAAAVALSDRIPLQRDWGRMALVPYAVGAIAALALAMARARTRAAGRARVGLAAAVLVGSAFLPMALEVWWRARDGFADHVQSETLVTEESAVALLGGHDPYAASFASGPLGSWPSGTAEHVPYLPGMFAFGLPRAVAGDIWLTDARLWFAVVSVTALAMALWLAQPPPARRLTALVVVLAPTGARYMAGGGDDVTVLSLMLLSLVLLHRKEPAAAGLAAGLAAAIKQTAWPLLPFLILAARDKEGRRASGRTLAAASAVMLPLIAPFVVWNPAAFVRDVVLFPLGLARQPTLAASPTLGRLLAEALALPKGVVAGALLLIVLLVAGYLAFLRPPTDARGAAERTALVMLLAILLATAGRFGYLLYPIGLFAWARLVLVPEPPEGVVMNTDTRTLRWSFIREGARAAKGSGL
jgi:Glycosyltransferase family 87